MIGKIIGAGLLTCVVYQEAMAAANKHQARMVAAATAAGGLDNAAKHKTFAATMRSKALFAGAALSAIALTAVIVGGDE